MNAKHLLLAGCGAAACLVVILFVGGAIWLGSGPVGGVRLSNDMETYAEAYLDEHGILDESEKLLAYYDVTLALDATESVILTSTRVIYHKEGENTEIRLADIEDIHHREETLAGDIFEISSHSGPPMKIEIAPFNQGKTFKNVLMKAWKRAGGKP